MKKLLSLIMVLALAGNVHAQSAFQQVRRLQTVTNTTTNRASITPDEDQAWWGYVDAEEQPSGLGVNSTDTYHCAIFIPGNHAVASGKTIQAVRFGLVAPNATDVKVWLSANLPGTIDEDNTLQLISVPDKELNNTQIDVRLDEPYTIPASGVYVGYSFTISKIGYQNDAYPILIAGEEQPNALIIRTNTAVPNWQDMYGQGFGSLYLWALLEGEFGDNQATPQDLGNLYGKTGESVTASLTVANYGITPLSSIDYTITTDGVVGAEQHADFSQPIAFNTSGQVTVTIPTEATQSKKEKTLTITKTNGNNNEAADKEATLTLYSLTDIIDRNVVVEEFTGTGCGWCPRGMIGMQKLRTNYGDRFVGIAIHQYNTADAMYIAPNSYASLGFTGAPSCALNRKAIIDPYYGTDEDICDDFEAEMEIPALSSVNVSGSLDETQTQVTATATIKSLFDQNYQLEFVLIADGLTGTTSAWNQSNYYYQYTAAQLPEDLQQFGKGGVNGQSVVKGWEFDDVAIASSYKTSKNQVAELSLQAGVEYTTSYTLTLPTKATLKNALLMDQLYVIALLVDKSGEIVNAAKQQVKTDADGIRDINLTTGEGITARYTLDGRRTGATHRGLSIIRLADGTTLKVMK